MEKHCDICRTSFSDPTNPSGEDILCKTCKEIVKNNAKKKNSNAKQVKEALKNAVYFDKEKEQIYFLCYYTGIPCNINPGFKSDSSSLEYAFDLTFDHKDPSIGYEAKGEELVVCLNIINQVKSNIPANIFKEFIILLADRFKNKSSSIELEIELKRLFGDARK
ncbi:MAG: hypothetical protein KKI06_13845 [Euryarchaeota archaeon]|nr:hypothetical protein [Euryarchaeota archaeon]